MTTLAFPDTAGKPTDGSFTYEANGVIYSWTGDYWAANNAQGFDQRYVNVDGDQMTGDLTVPSLNGGPLAGMRNRFINGSMQVVQRGAAGAAGVTRAMTCDRWYVHNDAAQTYTWDQVTAVAAQQAAGFRKALRVRNASDTYQFRQLIELSEAGARDDFIEGSTWTVSIYSTVELDYQVQWRSDRDGESVGSTISVVPETAMTETPAGSGRYVGTFTFPTGSAAPDNTTISLGVSFRRSDGGTGATQVTGAQLEPGSVATPFEQRPIGTELALCQRYFYTGGSIFAAAAGLDAFSSSTAIASLVYPVTMRAAPTLENVDYLNCSKKQAESIANDRIFFFCNPSSSSNNALVANYKLDAEL